jgi:sugar/nucleoside kinase (ribokinase family)
LLKDGAGVVAVKAGRKGCILGHDGHIRRIAQFNTKPFSTIGAGDAFDAAFIYGSIQGWPVEKRGRFANVVAAISTTQLGCMTAIPRAQRAERITESYYGHT